MFQDPGEVIVLVMAVAVTWMVAWGIAERRAVTQVARPIGRRSRVPAVSPTHGQSTVRVVPGRGDRHRENAPAA